ncbi:hypothetical protein GCM10028858_22190 [Halorubrum pallidum]
MSERDNGMSRNRQQNGEAPDAVHLWICRITGSKDETTTYCDRERARRWVRARLGSDGEWRSDTWKDVYDAGQDTGIVEFSVVQDAVGIVFEGDTTDTPGA